MKFVRKFLLSGCALLAITTVSFAVDIGGGQTSVALDTETLSSAASLTLSGVSDDVISPGAIDGSVAFAINPRDAADLPTTFSFDENDFLGTFSGTIEHTGSVFFNDDTVEVGNFTIGFDAARAGTLEGAASGFFVESTAGIPAILFDVENPTSLVPSSSGVDIAADLLVSPEFASFLLTNQLATANLAGADVGDAFVGALVPEPSSSALAMLAIFGVLGLRRSRS